MKILIASDIHGSNYYTKKLAKVIDNENIDKIILLGDIYYHGPRNKFPRGYAPMKVAETLNKYIDKLTCIKGNCDAEVDQMISKFKFEDSLSLSIKNKNFLFTHGHKLDFENLPKAFDFIFAGHTHISSIKEFGNTFYINPGSISLPKENSKNSYAIIDDSSILICDFKGTILHQLNF